MSSFKCLSSFTIMSSAPAHGTTCSDQWLKLTPSKSNFSQPISPSFPSQSQSHTRESNTTTTTTIMKTNDDCNMKSEKADEDTGGGGWSFLQCLTNNNNNKEEEAAADCNEKVYVHPLVKRSSSMLSEKSLEMCTESLGSETGSSLVSDSSDDDDIITGINNYPSTQMRGSNLVKKRTSSSPPSFPPPLTSISSSNSVKVRPHREGGRLVLQAVTVPSSPPAYYFQAERSDGRLRLCLVKDLDCVPNEEDQEEEEEEEEELAEEVDDKEDEDEDEDVDEDYRCDYDEDEEGESENDSCEIGIENLPRPSSRCNAGVRKDGNRLNWETFLVAT